MILRTQPLNPGYPYNFVKYYNVGNENYIILISKAHCCPDDINSRYI